MRITLDPAQHELDWAAGPQYDSPTGKTRSASFWSTGAGVPADNSISSGGECGLAYKLLPSGGATSAAPYYAFAAGLTTVVSITTELNLTAGSAQGEWLRATLAAIDRSVTPWVMVYGHRSPYVKPKSGSWGNYDARYAGDWNSMQYFAAALEPLLLRYSVDLVYSGHTHVTQRNCATANFSCVQKPTPSASGDGFVEYTSPQAPVYLVVGNLGANTDGTNAANTPPPWLDFESASFAYARVVVRSAAVLEVTLVDTGSGLAIDRSRIVKAAPLPPGNAAAAAKPSGAVIGASVAGALLAVGAIVVVASNSKARALLSRGRIATRYAPFETASAAANPAGPGSAGPPPGPVVVVAETARALRVASARGATASG